MMTSLVNMSYSMNNNSGKPKLVWVIEPENKIRFRYKSEGGSHGGLNGKYKENGRKTYPTVKLEDYHGSKSVFIKVSLHTEDKKAHVLEFKGKKAEDGIPYIQQNLQTDNTAEFTNLQILSKKKDEVEKILTDQKWEKLKDGIKGCSRQQFEKKIKTEIKGRAKAILNSVRLHFEAFEKDKPNVPLCTLHSEIICNLRDLSHPVSPVTYPKLMRNKIAQKSNSSVTLVDWETFEEAASKGDLRIFQLSHASGSCRGSEDVILLCSKVEKDTIKIRFFELDDNEKLVWEDYGKFSPADVHYQVAISFKTPPYPDNVQKKVFICLERKEELSEPREFTYIPEVSSKKRKLNTVEPVIMFSSECVPPVSPESISTMSMSSPGSSNEASADLFFPQPQCDDLIPEDIFKLLTEMNDCLKYDQGMWNDCQLPFEGIVDGTLDLGDGEIVQCDGVGIQNRELQYEVNQCYPIFDFIGKKHQKDMRKAQGEMGDVFDMKIFEGLMSSLSINAKTENDFTSNVLNKSTIKESEKRKYLRSNLQKKKQELSNLLFKRDNFGNTLLHTAVLENKPVQMILRLNQIMNIDLINMKNLNNQTVLHMGTERNNLNLVKTLLKNGSNPNLQDIDGNNCYHIAARNNCDDVMQVILQEKCCNFLQPAVSDFNYEGLTPSHIAIVESSLDCFKLMKFHLSNPNTKEKKTGKSLLHYAVNYQPSFVAELLNLTKIDVDIKDFEGNTPLHIACATGNTYVVKLLLQAGANPLLKNFKQKHNILENSEDDACDGQIITTTSNTEENSEDNISDGQVPADMTTNVEILKMLENAIKTKDMTESNFRDCHIKRHNTDVNKSMQKLCLYLDEGMKWEAVANYFLDKMFIDSLRLSTSPSKSLFEHIKKQDGKNYIESIKQVLAIEGLNEAVELIEECL